MSGHNKWQQIKHKKEVTDKKRGKVFSKILSAIRTAAKEGPNPDFNPRLRTVVEKAKEANIPQENIERALKQAADKNTEDIIIEAYGPSGSAIIITAVTDNKNRTIAEIRKILSDNEAKTAEPGSVLWAFDKICLPANKSIGDEWVPKFPQAAAKEATAKIKILIEALEEHEDVSAVYTNILL